MMHPWFSVTAPLTVRSENVPEINYIWLVRNLIEQGHPFTAWHPKSLGGEAVASHLMYPFYWLVALVSSLSHISPETLYKALVYADLLLGCVAMYEFLLQLTKEPAAGLVAGLIFGLIPGHMNSIEGFFIKISWLAVPLTFWLYEREFGQVRRPSLRGGGRLGLAVGLMGLASIQIPLIIVFILPTYILLREWQARGKETGSDSSTQNASPWLAWLRPRGAAWLVAGGVALGLTVFYYVPALIELNYLAFSRFADGISGQTIDLNFLLYMLVARWFPGFSPDDFHQVTWYIGDVALLMALGGLFSGRKERIVLFFAGAGLLSLLLLVGDSLGPLPNVVYRGVDKLPIIRGALNHSFRWILPFSFCLATLAGFGAAALRRWRKQSGSLSAKTGMVLLAGLLIFDYFPLSGSFRATPGYLRASEMEAFTWLDRQETGYRYFVPFATGTGRAYDLAYAHHLCQRPGLWDDDYVSHYVSKRAYFLFAGFHVRYPLLSSGFHPLFLQMLDLGAVRYVILYLDSTNHHELFRTATALGAPVVFEQDQVRILVNPNAKPFMQLYPQTALYQGDSPDEEALAWLPVLTSRGIALLDGVKAKAASELSSRADYLLIESEIELEALPASDRARALWPERVAQLPRQTVPGHRLEWYRPNPTRAEVRIWLEQAATLVFAEAWYPGWHVYVDGVEQPLLRANYAFQGVILPTGKHTVIFQYNRPFYVWIAGGISLATLLITLASLIRK
jgi:hypothetical protein